MSKDKYDQDKYRKLYNEGHVMHGDCPCGNNHDLTDKEHERKRKAK
jgi:hypothetical protein